MKQNDIFSGLRNAQQGDGNNEWNSLHEHRHPIYEVTALKSWPHGTVGEDSACPSLETEPLVRFPEP